MILLSSREYPDHPRPSCHALILNGDQVLLIQRAAEPLKGYWGLPGGSIELGEEVASAVAREVQEETGLIVKVDRLLGYKDGIQRDISGSIQYHFVILYFATHATGGQLQAGDDAAQARWVPVSQIHSLPLTDSVTECLRHYGFSER